MGLRGVIYLLISTSSSLSLFEISFANVASIKVIIFIGKNLYRLGFDLSTPWVSFEGVAWRKFRRFLRNT